MDALYPALRGTEVGETKRGVLRARWSLYTKFKDISQGQSTNEWLVLGMAVWLVLATRLWGGVTVKSYWLCCFSLFLSLPYQVNKWATSDGAVGEKWSPLPTHIVESLYKYYLPWTVVLTWNRETDWDLEVVCYWKTSLAVLIDIQ